VTRVEWKHNHDNIACDFDARTKRFSTRPTRLHAEADFALIPLKKGSAAVNKCCALVGGAALRALFSIRAMDFAFEFEDRAADVESADVGSGATSSRNAAKKQIPSAAITAAPTAATPVPTATSATGPMSEQNDAAVVIEDVKDMDHASNAPSQQQREEQQSAANLASAAQAAAQSPNSTVRGVHSDSA